MQTGDARKQVVILRADFMIRRLTTGHENALSPLGEWVASDGVFISPSADGVG
jgi:hypothetical protein